MPAPGFRRPALVAPAAVCALCLAAMSLAAEAPPQEKAPVPAPAVQAPAAPGSAVPKAPEADQEKVLREQTIYVPYEKLRKVFEKEGRGVFLPYEKFRELWDAAQEKLRAPAEQKPPRASVITEIQSEATVAKDVVRVSAVLRIELLAEGWNEVPLRLKDAAITRATLDGRPARLTHDDAGYKLLVEKQGKEPKQIELALDYAKAITRAPGQNSVGFDAPQAPVNRWRVRVPEAGVRVNVHPMIAAPETPAEAKPDAKPEAKPEAAKPEETSLVAFVGAAPTVRIEWTPKAEGATGLAALASAQVQQQVVIAEGVTRTKAELVYTVSRAELGRLVIEVPADQKIVNVFDPNVQKWGIRPVKPEDKTQQIEVQLFEPAKASQTVLLELEKAEGDAPKTTVEAPVVRAVDAGRQQGVVVVQVGQGLRAEASSVRDLLQVDAGPQSKDVHERLRGPQWAFAYRYATVPYELKLDVEKVQPRILADSLVEACVEPDRISLDVLSVFTIERAGAFKLEFDVPAGFEVRRVEGRAAAGAPAALVDSHHLAGEQKTRLAVHLAQKALGRVGVAVALERLLREPDLNAPTGKAVKIALAMPRVAPGAAEVAQGRLLVHATEGLRLSAADSPGLRAVPLDEPLKGIGPARPQKPPGTRPVLAFAYVETAEPVGLALAAERRKPQVTVAQLLVAAFDEGVVKYENTLFYDVRYSGVKALRIDLPAALAAKVNPRTPGVEKVAVDKPEPKPAEGYTAWDLKGASELLGRGRIELAWEDPMPPLEIAKPVSVAVPRFRVVGADRAPGKIVLKKAETIDVREHEKTEGLRPIDPQLDLKDADTPDAEVPGAARAFAFDDAWSLSVEVTRFQLEEVKRTSIERAAVRMVMTRAGRVPVQALYRVRSARQRLAVTLPEGAEFDTQPLRIDGQPKNLESGDKTKNEYFVPLVDPDPDRDFVLELRYTVPGAARSARLDLPEFPEEGPAVQKVFLCVYTPKEWVPLAFTGPWTEEFSWELDDSLQWRPQALWTPQRAVQWVTERIHLAGDPAGTFQTDGQAWVFSTLAPEAAPGGSLSLRAMERTALNLAVLGVVLAGGLLLAPARACLRATAVGALVAALVLCGVFAPTFAAQVGDGDLGAALLVVLAVWSVWFFARRARRTAVVGGPPTEPPPPESPGEFLVPEEPPQDGPQPDDEPVPDDEQGGPSHA